ncbi:MAG: ATP-binding protein, partial [Ferruginibacter sp.]
NVNTEHAGFVMDYKLRDDRLIWVAGKRGIPSQLTIPYFDCEYYNRFNEAKEKGLDFFATNLNFEDKNIFYRELFNYLPGLPEDEKEFYFSCPGLAISTVLLENVGLYIENFEGIPYSDEDNATLMRFGKVFQQTYTRFLDLQKAEAQAKEAKIEAALERTRTQSMIMQHSKELDNTLRVFHEQVLLLNIHSAFSFLWLPDEEKDQHKFWAAWAEETCNETIFKSKAIDYPLDRNEPATAQCLIDWKSGEPVYSYAVPPEGVKNYFAAWQELIAGVEKLTPQHFAGGLYYVEAFMKYGCFGVILEKDLTADEKKILSRFAIEFERAYTRFLDLQKAEAQAREAAIEVSLERVRAKTMAMHNSQDVSAATAVMFNELVRLGVENMRSGIAILKDTSSMMEVWTATVTKEGHNIKGGGLVDTGRHPLWQKMYSDWKEGKENFLYHLKGDDLKAYYNALTSSADYSAPYINEDPPEHYCYITFFDDGVIFTFNTFQYSDEQKQILKRFASVFNLTYRRFLDLQKAEAQAREAQIEMALEKVRSRTLAMQKSDELAETAAEVFRQLISLGIEPNRLYIGIVKEETGDMEMWATDEDGTRVGKKFMFNKSENASVLKLYEGWKAQKKSVIVDMQGKELEDYFHYLNEVMHIPFKAGLTQNRRVQSVAYFSKGFIGMASPDGQGDETILLLERFAAVFNLTFTRFNDLKTAEAHAIQAEEDLIKLQTEKKRAEDTLTELQSTQKQLIQSEKMASLGELTAGIAHEIQNPLNFVNNFSELSAELIKEMVEEVDKGNAEEVKALAHDIVQNLEKINHHGKRADAIVKGMLQHSRSSNGVKEPTDINALCDEYLRLSYHGLRAKDKSFNATIKTDFDNTIGKINILPQDIGRVILNLLTNAFYVVDEKKKSGIENYEPVVTISTKRIGSPSGVGGKVEIKVSDNGNGIPQKTLDKIFQPFFTTKPTGQGTGLGLSLSYDIITKGHGGELKVETKVDEGDPGDSGKEAGSIFIIQIPTGA